jgi:hypothetical protein
MLRDGQGEEDLLVDPLPEGWHLETHNVDGTKHGRIPLPGPSFEHGLFTQEGSWVSLGAVRGARKCEADLEILILDLRIDDECEKNIAPSAC